MKAAVDTSSGTPSPSTLSIAVSAVGHVGEQVIGFHVRDRPSARNVAPQGNPLAGISQLDSLR